MHGELMMILFILLQASTSTCIQFPASIHQEKKALTKNNNSKHTFTNSLRKMIILMVKK